MRCPKAFVGAQGIAPLSHFRRCLLMSFPSNIFDNTTVSSFNTVSKLCQNRKSEYLDLKIFLTGGERWLPAFIFSPSTKIEVP
jgi:hypothetical protein